MNVKEMLDKLTTKKATNMGEPSTVDIIQVMDPFYEILFEIPFRKIFRGVNYMSLVPREYQPHLFHTVQEAKVSRDPIRGIQYFIIMTY